MRKIILLLTGCILAFSGCDSTHTNNTEIVETYSVDSEEQSEGIISKNLEYGYEREQTNNWYMSERTPSKTNYSAVNFDVNADIKYESLDETGNLSAFVNNNLFIIKGNTLLSINLTNHKTNWKYQMDDYIKKIMIKDEMIFIHTKHKVHAIKDMITGYKLLWKKGTQDVIIDMTFDDLYAYYLRANGELIAADSYTGEVIWSFEMPKDNNIFSRKLVTGDNKIFFTSDNVEVDSYQLYSLENKTGKILWCQNLEDSSYPSSKVPVYIDGRVFIDLYYVSYPKLKPSRIKAFNSESGNLLWEYKIEKPIDYKKGRPSLVVNKNYLVFTDTENNMYSLNTKSGTKAWKISLGKAEVLPIITNDMIFTNVDRSIKAFDITNGSFLKEFGVDQEYIYPSIINSQRLITVSETNIYFFNILTK